MSVDALVEPLRKVSLFQGLSPEQLQVMARKAERIVFRPGDKIIEDGADTEAAFVIVSGESLRTAGPDVGPAGESVVAGSLLGEMSMFVETQHTSTIVAKTPVRALKITRQDMHAHMEADPTIADHFVHLIANRLHLMAAELRQVEAMFDVVPPAAAETAERTH